MTLYVPCISRSGTSLSFSSTIFAWLYVPWYLVSGYALTLRRYSPPNYFKRYFPTVLYNTLLKLSLYVPYIFRSETSFSSRKSILSSLYVPYIFRSETSEAVTEKGILYVPYIFRSETSGTL